ncbi:hypothetical protein C3495_14375 (plasmid) [Clostridiaceae bacterium 14S0207]|nr:hypothetical protein C3495_14375 [Clostridiaceae bacterium 14S0207]
MKLYAKNYKNSDSLIQDIKKFFNKGQNVGIVGKPSLYTNTECFLCEFNHNDMLDNELMKEENYKELKKFIINSCNFNNEKNTLTVNVKLKGFEEVNKQLDILIDKCNKLNKCDSKSNVDVIAKELIKKLRLDIKHD